MSAIRYNGNEYGGPTVHVQNDSTATDLDDIKVPNGQTIKSYLNNSFSDTKNTAGATNSTSTLYLVGAKTQGDNPQTYTNSSVYASNGSVYASNFYAGYLTLLSSNNSIRYKNINSYYQTSVFFTDPTSNRSLYFPNKGGTLAVDTDLAWKALYAGLIVPTSTSTTYTPTVDLSTIKELMVAFNYGSSTSYRNSVIFTGDDFRSGYAFPDIYFAGSRLYCSVTKNSSGKIVVGSAGSSGSTGWSTNTMQIKLYYR